ncbi:Maff2 family protein [Erysipelothrix rhusiopathiae]|nr:Maff2 family protein [Erysipelothrix rhusiopathiae]
MQFFITGVDVLQKLVILIGAGLGVWGIINLLEGYGNDNPGAKSQGMKQFMSGAGLVLVAMMLIPALKSLFV